MTDRPDYWRQTKFIELIENIENIENIETIETITTVATIALINRLALIDAITNIVNIDSIDLIDRISLIDEITEISKVRGLHWYDRNPVNVVKTWYMFEQAPHALAERWEYEVPTGKMAYVEVLQTKVVRTKAASSASYAGCWIKYTPNGESFSNFLESFIITNTVGDKDEKTLGQSMLIFAGDKLEGETYDLSTGGECYLLVNAKITEFDE